MMWGLHKALVVSHATVRVHRAAWRRGGNEHFATCGACLEAPEVERGNRYSALRMTAKGQAEKNSLRAYVFRPHLELGHCSMQSASLKGARAQSRCAPARCAGAGAESPVAS